MSEGRLIMELHNGGKDDHTPMQMISAKLLAHLRAAEAELAALKAAQANQPATPPGESGAILEA